MTWRCSGCEDGELDPQLLASGLEELEEVLAKGNESSPGLAEVLRLVSDQPLVHRELRRRRTLRAYDLAREQTPGASSRALAEVVSRRTGEAAETVRRWVRERSVRAGGGSDAPLESPHRRPNDGGNHGGSA